MSSILDALRKVEREKAEVTQAVEVDFDEAAAERDLIGGTDGRGHMVLHLPPWLLMAFGGAFVLAVVAAAGLGWLWMRGPEAAPPVVVAASAPKPPVAPAPKPEPPAPAVVESIPVVKQPEPEIVVAKAPTPEPVVEPIKPEPPAREEVVAKKSEDKPKPIAKAVEERIEARPAAKDTPEEATPVEEAAVKPTEPEVVKKAVDKPADAKPVEEAAVTPEEPKPEEKANVKPDEPETEPAPEAVQLAKAETMPEPLPETVAPPVVIPAVPEPLKSAARPPEPIESAVPDEPEKANEGAVLPPSEEDRRLIKLNMPRPANKRNPYASAIINLQPVFLNEMIPDTNAKLVSVEEKGVIILKQDTGTRHFIPF